jgi:hypothetical protein
MCFHGYYNKTKYTHCDDESIDLIKCTNRMYSTLLRDLDVYPFHTRVLENKRCTF